MSGLMFLALIGCAPGPIGAPFGSTISLTNLDEFAIAIDAGLLEPGDGIGALVRLEAFVTITDTYRELPGNNIRVDVTSGWSQAYLLPEEAVRVVDDYEVECEESGGSQDPEDPCSAWFNSTDSTWVEFGGDYTDLENFRPTYFTGATDARGLLHFYAMLDSVPVDVEGEPIPFSVYATIGVDDAAVTFDFGG